MQLTRISIDKLSPNNGQIDGLPENPRKWKKEDVERLAKSLRETPELFEARPIVAVPYRGGHIILGGNMRYEAAKFNGDKDAPVFLLDANTPIEKMKEVVIKDNSSFGEWDTKKLMEDWVDLPLPDWGVDEGTCKVEGFENIYTQKVESPVYEIRGECPSVNELYDDTKTKKLLKGIEKSELPKELKDFLRVAAYRHAEINYSKVAEFYAHASAEIQRLFEDSALVIIDFKQAVQKGYVKMMKSLQEIYDGLEDEE